MKNKQEFLNDLENLMIERTSTIEGLMVLIGLLAMGTFFVIDLTYLKTDKTFLWIVIGVLAFILIGSFLSIVRRTNIKESEKMKNLLKEFFVLDHNIRITYKNGFKFEDSHVEYNVLDYRDGVVLVQSGASKEEVNLRHIVESRQYLLNGKEFGELFFQARRIKAV